MSIATSTSASAIQVTPGNANEHLRRLITTQAEAWGCKVEFRAANDGDEENPLDVFACVSRDDWNEGLASETPGFYVQLRAFAMVSPARFGSSVICVNELVLAASTCVYYGEDIGGGFESHQWLSLAADNARVQAWSSAEHLRHTFQFLESNFADRAEVGARRALANRAKLVAGISRLAEMSAGSAWTAVNPRHAQRTVDGARASGMANATVDANGVTVSMRLQLGFEDAMAILAMVDSLNRQ